MSLFESALHGIYVHGSFAMGGFNSRSDIDMLAVVSSIHSDQYEPLARLTLAHSGNPYPLEISVVEKMTTWMYPPAFKFHFSESKRSAMRACLEDHKHSGYQAGFNADLAVEIEQARQRSICLYGRSASELFPPVPWDHVIDAILQDLDWAWAGAGNDAVYPVLNGCRAYIAFSEARLTSKNEAGLWPLQTCPFLLI